VELVAAIFGFMQVSFAEIVFEQLREINVCNMLRSKDLRG
jgi:hypothetical protein